MKIRNGFVSNSSSSSFVVIATQDAIDKALAVLDKKGKELINEYILYRAENQSLNGQELIVAFGTISTEDFGCEVYDENDTCEQPQQDWETFVEELRKNGGIVMEK